MKKRILIQGLAIVLGCVLISSCQKNEPKYSCDPEIDEIVTKNIDEIHQMSRADIVELEPEMTRACFRAFTKEQKLAFWQDKLQEVLSLGWNENEANHIEALAGFVNENADIFDKDFSSNVELNDKLDVFAYKWKEYAEETLNWSRELILAIVANPYKVLNKEGKTNIELASSSNDIKTTSERPKCSCNMKFNDCEFVPCGKSLTCINTLGGCGFLNSKACDGTCY